MSLCAVPCLSMLRLLRHDTELEADLMVCVLVVDVEHQGVKAALKRMEAYRTWRDMEKDGVEFVRQYQHCANCAK